MVGTGTRLGMNGTESGRTVNIYDVSSAHSSSQQSTAGSQWDLRVVSLLTDTTSPAPVLGSTAQTESPMERWGC